jgi:hypothetical protein
VAAATGLGITVRTGWAVAVAVRGRTFGARWALRLVPEHLPRQPYHAAQELPPAEAERLVGQVEETAAQTALAELRAIVTTLPGLAGIALVANPGVVAPATVADGFRTHMAMHAAEGALYRDCVAEACESLGFTAVVLAADELAPHDALIREFGAVAGRPWRREHKDAARAALAVVSSHPDCTEC